MIKSGSKYKTEAGFSAIKDGQKEGREAAKGIQVRARSYTNIV
jgi:hypothetical protein